jgi:DNA-binding NarL/FixJ family response regulator
MPKLRIFLVEDNEMVSGNLIAAIHEMSNVEVRAVARTENQALVWMDENTADVYIVDVMLRNGHGNGLNILKKAETNPGTWIVFSNHSIPEVVRAAKQHGAHYVLDKSNEVDTLLQLLQRMASRIE